MFADRADDFVLHQDSMELLGCGVKERRPDRIFGLENTAMFDRYISNKENERFRHSPFADGKVLYPFLVIEAKSEKGSPGFESIESQTAFPIRSLLQLQDRLARHSEIEMNPLLWFLANQGDEWRVYAAVMNSSKFVSISPSNRQPTRLTTLQRVFDLWHGTILSQDCALQLLLIIDSICEWARDIYRLDVLRCLSGGQLDLRAVTPAWSTTQSQHESRSGSDEPSSSSAGTVTPQVESPPPLATLADPALDHLVPELDVAMIDMDVFDDDLQQVPPMIADSLDDSVPRTGSIYPDTSQALLRYDKSHPNAPKWTELGTIQHSNLVQFKFQYCMIPDTFASFCQFLTDANEPENLAALAREILSTFESNYSILTEISTVTELAELWVEDATLLKGLENSSNNLVQVIVKFNTYFDIGSWQTIRVLDCFVCSQTAWNLLIMVSRLVDPRANDPWMSDRRADLCLHVQPLKTLHGKDATAAALQNLDTVLCIPASADSAKTGLIWREYNDFPEENQFIFRGNLWQRVDDSWRYFRWTSKQRELHPTSSGPLWLQSMIQTHKMKSTYGAILLRKPPTWPETCPFFCLAVFDPVVDFESERKVGRLLDQVLLANDIYVVSDDESKPRTFSDVDFRACHLWSNILAGDALAETPWPVMQ